MKAQEVEEIVNESDRILHDTYGHDVLKYEQILLDFRSKFKETHYLVLTVKKFLGDLYGLCEGFEYPKLSLERFQRKIDFLKDFIDVVNHVDPGYTRVII